MLEKTTRLVSENLARAMNRRQLLRRAGEGAFVGMAALAAGHGLPGRAFAQPSPKPPVPAPTTPQCSPPGPYCNLDGISQPSGCHGGQCYQHLYQGQVLACRVYYQYYQAGCWTTAVSGGYWTCCDCECSSTPGGTRLSTCGCASFSGSPAPRPDGIKSS